MKFLKCVVNASELSPTNKEQLKKLLGKADCRTHIYISPEGENLLGRAVSMLENNFKNQAGYYAVSVKFITKAGLVKGKNKTKFVYGKLFSTHDACDYAREVLSKDEHVGVLIGVLENNLSEIWKYLVVLKDCENMYS